MFAPGAAFAVVLAVADPPTVEVKPGYALLYSTSSCWSVAFTGPAYREGVVRAAAEERFAKPGPEALRVAKRRVATIHVFPDSTMECGGELPQTVVVRDDADATTLTRIPLRAKADTRTNAFGVSQQFGEGDAEITLAMFKAVFDGGPRVVYVLTSGGRRGGWRVGSEMQAVHDAAGWQIAEREAKVEGYKDRFASVCSPGSQPTDPVWLILDVLAAAIEPGATEVREAAKGQIPCLEQLRQGPDATVAASAEKLLAKLKE